MRVPCRNSYFAKSTNQPNKHKKKPKKKPTSHTPCLMEQPLPACEPFTCSPPTAKPTCFHLFFAVATSFQFGSAVMSCLSHVPLIHSPSFCLFQLLLRLPGVY